MRSQMCFLGIIEGFEQGTLIDRRTGITYVRRMKPHRTDFFNKIRTMFITATGPAINSVAAFSCTVFTAQRGRFGLTGFPVFAGIERVTGFACGDLYSILPDFS